MYQNEQGLTEILRNKVNQRLEQGAANALPVVAMIEKESRSLDDMLVPIGRVNDVIGMEFLSQDNLTVKMINGSEYTINDHAMSQAAEKLGIPTAYIKKLARPGSATWERDLAATVLNRHSYHTDRTRVLVRTVGSQIRGILSDKYRRLNTSSIYEQFIRAATRAGARVVGAHLSNVKSYIEVLIPTLFPVQTEKNGIIHIVFGAQISNSDFGAGTLDVRTYFEQAVCLNGMVTKGGINQRHLGSRIPDDILISEETYRKDTDAMASLVNDIVTQMLSPEKIKQQIASIEATASKAVNLEHEIKKLPTAGVMKEEVKLVEAVLMNGREEDGLYGEPTMWKFTQALTAVARDAEPQRRRDLEEIAGKLMVELK